MTSIENMSTKQTINHTHTDLLEKYAQVKVLINSSSTNTSTYYLTEIPKFTDISKKLYEKIIKSNEYDLYKIDRKYLEQLFEIPILHHKEEPTLEEVLFQIPYLKNYDIAYIYIGPFDYTIGEYHVSKLNYRIQVGEFDSTGIGTEFEHTRTSRINKKQKTEKITIFDNNLIVKRITLSLLYGNNTCVIGKTLTKKDLDNKYKLVDAIKMEDFDSFDYSTGMINVCSQDKTLGTAFMWDDFNHKNIIGKYDPKTKNIQYTDGKTYAKFLMTIPTFHTWNYYGFFKPDFEEVLTQMPESVFKSNKKLLITTNVASDKPNKIIVGDYHVGKTTIWEII